MSAPVKARLPDAAAVAGDASVAGVSPLEPAAAVAGDEPVAGVSPEALAGETAESVVAPVPVEDAVAAVSVPEAGVDVPDDGLVAVPAEEPEVGVDAVVVGTIVKVPV